MALYKYNPEHFHDASGHIFTARNAYDETLWELARDKEFKIDDVFIRDYNEDGSIRGYYELDNLSEYLTHRIDSGRSVAQTTCDAIDAIKAFCDERNLMYPWGFETHAAFIKLRAAQTN